MLVPSSVLLRAFTLAGIPVTDATLDASLVWQLTFAANATQAQKTAATTLLARYTHNPEGEAQQLVDDMTVFMKAVVLTLLDQLNVVRAGLPVPLGALTPAQTIAAIRTKAGTL